MGTHAQQSHFDTNQFNVAADGTVTNNILTGSGAPSVAPDFVGQLYIDSTNKHVYVSVATSDSGDWENVNGA